MKIMNFARVLLFRSNVLEEDNELIKRSTGLIEEIISMIKLIKANCHKYSYPCCYLVNMFIQ